ncbi:phage holin, partial [Lactococcus lactis]
MKTIDKGTLTRTILLWLAILNQILTALNMNPLPL